jgi:hypothetical protein
MTPQEFKAWFDGFTEAFTGCPTKAQWARIKERVSEIDGKPVTERVYVDRYWPAAIPYNGYPYWSRPYWGLSGGVAYATNNTNAAAQSYASAVGSVGQASNSLSAMSELGRADAQALAA